MDTPWEKPMGQPGEFAWLLDGSSLLPSFTSFPLPPPLPPLFGPPAAWTDAGAPPEPARPVLTPLELVIHDRSLGGWVTLAYSPGVDLTQPIALVLDDRRLGPVTIGWITPADLADPHATTIRLTHETQPLPGHQSLHRPEDWTTEAGAVGGETDDFGGSDAGAAIQPAAWAGGVPKDALGDVRADAGDIPETVGTHAYDLAISQRQADAVDAAKAVEAGQSIPAAAPKPKAKPAKAGQRTVPPPIDVASLPPGPFGPADYERAVARNRYLAGLYDPESAADRALNLVTGAMSDPANVLTPGERAEHLALNAKFRETLFPPPTPQEARLDAMLDSPLGTAASVVVGAVGGSQRAQDVALATGATIDTVGAAVAGLRGPEISGPRVDLPGWVPLAPEEIPRRPASQILAVGGARAGEASEFLNAQIGQDLAAQPPTETETFLLPPPPPPPPPLTAEQQVRALSGHGDSRHGPGTTMEQHETRVLTGQTPDGKYGRTSRATRFDSYEAELDAVQRAIRQTEARDAAGLISHVNVVTSDGRITLPSVRVVVTGFPGGYGSGVKRSRGTDGSIIVSPTGQDPNAVVVLERDPRTGKWNPITQYPTDEPKTP